MLKGEKLLQDFNIQKEAGGSKRAVVKTFQANVNNTVMDIHFYWAGRGTCCIPFQSTYGPLVSAIHVTEGSQTHSHWFSFNLFYFLIREKKRTWELINDQLFSLLAVSDSMGSSKNNKKRIGKIVGITVGSAAGVLIIASIFFVWWTKKAPARVRGPTASPRKG